MRVSSSHAFTSVPSCALEVLHLRGDAIDHPVEAGDLRMEAVDQAPEQRLAQRVDGVIFVPHLAAVELASLGACAVEREALADGCGLCSGCGGVAVRVEHDDLACSSSEALHLAMPKMSLAISDKRMLAD